MYIVYIYMRVKLQNYHHDFDDTEIFFKTQALA